MRLQLADDPPGIFLEQREPGGRQRLIPVAEIVGADRQDGGAGWALHTNRGARKYLNADERRRFLAAARSAPPEVRAFCHVLVFLGLRISEALSLTEQFDSDSAHGRFALQMHGAMAEYFLDLNRERTMEGLKAALARGRKGGRPRKVSDADLEAGRALLAAGTIPVAEIAKRLGIARKTFYTYFPQARARSQAKVDA